MDNRFLLLLALPGLACGSDSESPTDAGGGPCTGASCDDAGSAVPVDDAGEGDAASETYEPICEVQVGGNAAAYDAQGVLQLSPDLGQVPREETCSGPDLYVDVLGACGECDGNALTLRVANRGTVASGFRLVYEDESVEVTDPVAPQGASQLITIEKTWSSGTLQVTVPDGVSDCTPADNHVEVFGPIVDCFI